MDQGKIRSFIKEKRRYNTVNVAVGLILLLIAIVGFVWLQADDHRTLFGRKVNVIEPLLLEQKQVCQAYEPLEDEALAMKERCIRFAELSLTQNQFIFKLIDYGFLAMMQFIGVLLLLFSFSFMKQQKDLLKMLEESNS